MDNYLVHRWPAGMAAPPKEKKGKKQKKKKNRRLWRDLLILVLAVVLLCGLTAGSFFGIQYAAERYMEQLPDEPSVTAPGTTPGLPSASPSLPAESDPVEEDPWFPEMLPEGDPDPSVQLELLPREGEEALTAPEVYEKVLPSMVCVQAYNERGYSTGSGIIISESGYIMTNYHVVEGGTSLAIILLSDSSVYDAALVGYDKELDLAILKAEEGHFIPAEIGNSDELTEGDAVYAIGNPMGYLRGVMSDGIVSSCLDERVAELDYSGRLILTTATLNSGNSGGALVDAYGRVVGITYAKVTGIRNDTVVEGLGLAIPISDARPYLNRILRTGDSARPSLGIQCYSPVTVNGVTGIEVAEATLGTPAHGKLLPGDLIIELNGVRVYVVDDVTRILSEMDAGDEVELTVIRKGKEITVVVALYDRLSELQ